MHELLPQSREIRVTQTRGRVTAEALERVDQLLLILPQRPPRAIWRLLPGGTRLESLLRQQRSPKDIAFQSRLANKRQTFVVAGKIGPDASAFSRLTLARKLVAAATRERSGTLGILVLGFDDVQRKQVYFDVIAAAQAAAFRMPEFKAKKAAAQIRGIRVLGLDDRLELARTRAEAQGNNLTRWLTALPPNKLDALAYSSLLEDLAEAHAWDFKRLSVSELEEIGAGAFLAVAQGNDDDSASIVRLRYRPEHGRPEPDIALVGKGIIFDTGGTNLKSFNAMLDMHADMQGSAVALGTLLAFTLLESSLAIDCWLAITENRTGPRAYKSQDVVTAANGKTIQTVHTDAEGRMALADALVLASRENPRLIVDYATLTGSVIRAITNRYSGVFTNRAEWHPRLKHTGQACGERVWPFPIGQEFLEELKSEVADIQQCSADPNADHILAASFLAEFVENDTPWIHIDLAASEKQGGLGHVPTKITGFGVRYTLSLVLDENILETAD